MLHPAVMTSAVTLAILAMLVAFSRYGRLSRPWQRAATAWAGAIAIAFGLRAVQHVTRMIRDLPEWDFQAFWLYARVTAQGRNFYDPASYYSIHPSLLSYSEDFRRQGIDIGFPYPPWTALLISPLGWFEARPASVVWSLVQLAALAGAIVALWRIFRPAPGLAGLLFTAALLLSLGPTLETLSHGQINFLILLPLALYWAEENTWRGGTYLALAAVWKPLGAMFLLRPLLERSWRVVAGAATTLLVIVLVTIWSFGWPLSLSYFTSNLAGRMPRDVYIESNRQGLLSAMLRAEPWERVAAMANPIAHLPYVASASLVLLVTVSLVVALRRAHRDCAFALLVPCALLTYPATLTHSGVLLILPILFLWQTREVHGPTFAIGLICVVFFLTRYDVGHYAFFAYLLLWLALVAVAGRRLRAERALTKP